jgi:cell division protein FtsB
LQGQVAQVRAKQILALQEQSVLRERLAQKDDLQAIEDVAREELGLVKPGEQLIIFVKGE